MWSAHYKELLPQLKILKLDPKNREFSWREFTTGNYDVFMLHWDVLRLMPELATIKWLHVIADECHRAQNREVKQTKALKKIKASFKTGLSGTPITNTPDKLWSILNWLYPKVYTSYWKFFARYVDYTMEYANGAAYKKPTRGKNLEELHDKMAPFYVRHLKKEKCCQLHPNGVLPDLPEKYYSKIEVDLLPKQRKAYNSMRDTMIAWVGENEDTPLVSPVVIAQLVRLQQFAIGYAEFDESGSIKLTEPSSKIDALMQLIADNTDESFVVFSQFSQVIKLLNKRLESAKPPISYVTITGGVPDKLRDSGVDSFQSGKAKIFTGTIAAGGVGITLTNASTVVFLDRAWSPALNQQAEDRCHRNGQKNAVQVIDIVATDSVDSIRNEQIEMKWSVIKELLGDTQTGGNNDDEDRTSSK